MHIYCCNLRESKGATNPILLHRSTLRPRTTKGSETRGRCFDYSLSRRKKHLLVCIDLDDRWIFKQQPHLLLRQRAEPDSPSREPAQAWLWWLRRCLLLGSVAACSGHHSHRCLGELGDLESDSQRRSLLRSTSVRAPGGRRCWGVGQRGVVVVVCIAILVVVIGASTGDGDIFVPPLKTVRSCVDLLSGSI